MKRFTLVNLKKRRKVGQAGFDINKRIILSFREIGKGYSALEDFCGVMNMTPPMAKTTYYKHIPSVHEAYVTTASESMKTAVNELKEDVTQMIDIDVSVDGTWQRRGHASLNGVTTVISADNGKCVDFQVLTKSCKGCQYWENRDGVNPEEYSKWKESHKCNVNYEGSAGGMGKLSAVNIFKRSVQKNTTSCFLMIKDFNDRGSLSS